jgi:hypothetical protein
MDSSISSTFNFNANVMAFLKLNDIILFHSNVICVIFLGYKSLTIDISEVKTTAL